MLLGFFDLKPGVTEAAFHDAYAAFGAHLVETGYATGWASAARSPHDGYDVAPPRQHMLTEVRFSDRRQALAAWDYIASRAPAVSRLHDAVTCKVANADFTLYEIGKEG